MDCKCPSSGMKSNIDVLRKTSKMFNSKTQFKFVISNKSDYNYAKKMITQLGISSNIVFQPEWNNRKFARKLVDLVKKDSLNVRIILQQHKVI